MEERLNEMIAPRYFEVKSIGKSELGFISVAEFPENLPFEVKRVYWTYYTPQNIVRGYHAHKELHELIFAVSGIITFYTEDRTGHKAEFTLTEPNRGIHLPPYVWREIRFSHNAVLMCLASQGYKEEEYIRDYEAFKRSVI